MGAGVLVGTTAVSDAVGTSVLVGAGVRVGVGVLVGVDVEVGVGVLVEGSIVGGSAAGAKSWASVVVKAIAGANNAPTKSAKATKAHTLAGNKRFIERFLLIIHRAG